MTIPLAITLSDFQLSGFVILVFSRQKGLTIVFRNDPLESLKVSSTFDSIPFVANYLQKEIEGQLRILLMDELPAIIHRLSLRLFVPEDKARNPGELDNRLEGREDEPIVDPFASPPQDPVDVNGNILTAAEVAALSLDSHVETQSLFAQKNLIRLATLTDSHRTLSLFTPSIRDAVFRAWTGPLERGEMTGLHTRAPTPALSRTQSYVGSASTTYTFDSSSSHARPTLYSFPTAKDGSSLGAGRSKAHGARKKKKRVINLRKHAETGEHELYSEDGSTMTDTASMTESISDTQSVFSAPPAHRSSSIYQYSDPVTPPFSPISGRSNGKAVERTPMRTASLDVTSPSSSLRRSSVIATTGPPQLGELHIPEDRDRTIRLRQRRGAAPITDLDTTPRASTYLPERKEPIPASQAMPSSSSREGVMHQPVAGSSKSPLPAFLHFVADPANGGTIAERAWMMKMANEMARRYDEEREKGSFVAPYREDDDRLPPPAYAR